MCRIGRASIASVGVMVSPTKMSSIPETGNQVTRFSFLDFTTFQTKETEEFCNTEVFSCAIKFRKGNLVPNLNSTTEDTTEYRYDQRSHCSPKVILGTAKAHLSYLLELGCGQ